MSKHFCDIFYLFSDQQKPTVTRTQTACINYRRATRRNQSPPLCISSCWPKTSAIAMQKLCWNIKKEAENKKRSRKTKIVAEMQMSRQQNEFHLHSTFRILSEVPSSPGGSLYFFSYLLNAKKATLVLTTKFASLRVCVVCVCVCFSRPRCTFV